MTELSVGYVRLGQANLDGDTEALFRDYLVPELITAFEVKRIMKNYVRTKTITNANAGTFPVLGTTGAMYYQVGDAPLLGNQTIAHNQISIKVDPFLLSNILIPQLDVLLQSYEDRAEIAEAMTNALTEIEEKQILQTMVLAARQTEGIVKGREGGSVLNAGANVATDSDVLIEQLALANVELDNKKVPQTDRTAFVRPLQYARLAMNDKVIKSYIGGGSFELGTTGSIAGLKIVKTIYLPSEVIEQDEDVTKPNNIYYGDFTNTQAVVTHPGSVGLVSVKGLDFESEWSLALQGWNTVVKLLEGIGILKPDCAVEISSASGSTDSTDSTDGTTE